MGNSSSCDSCASVSDLQALTTKVNVVSDNMSDVPTEVILTTGDSPDSIPDINTAGGWLQKLQTGKFSVDGIVPSSGALQTCPSDQVMCGIEFVHQSGEKSNSDEYFRIKCCATALK
jgi:hypothetical protein